MRAIFSIFVLLGLVSLAPSRGQNSPDSWSTLSGIEGVVSVDTLSSELPLKGITRDAIRLKVEGALRAAGVPVLQFPPNEPLPGNPVLYLAVTTIFDEVERTCIGGRRLELVQTARLERRPDVVVRGAPTWGVGGAAQYSKFWWDEVMEDIGAFTSEFIDAYNRANPHVGD
jgi:hypothetical protein